MKIKSSLNAEITMSFTRINVNHVLVANLRVTNMSFNAIRENKILANFSRFTVLTCFMQYSIFQLFSVIKQVGLSRT